MSFSSRFLRLVFSVAVAFMLFGQYAAASPLAPSRTINARQLSSDTLPTHGGGTELPSPTAGLQLKAIGLGRGTQNYTCANTSATPVSVGALADLYDISMLPESVFNTITNMAVNMNINSIGVLQIDLLGHHYFTASGTPTFDLGSKGFLSAAKQGDIAAPAGANAGPAGTGAVDWLELGNKGGSTGVLEVYRVETAGGKAPATCAGQGATIDVQYAAQYWFYG